MPLLPEPLTLDEAKAHLRVDHDADDALIVMLIKVARERAEHLTELVLVARGSVSAEWPSPADIPAGIKQWMLVYLGTLYEHREGVVAGTIVTPIPRGFVDGLLDPWRMYR